VAEEKSMIKILLVDDQLSLKGLHMRIALESDLLVVGETSNSPAVIQLIEESSPDVVIMDLDMAGMEGIHTIQALRAKGNTTPVIILSFDPDLNDHDRPYTGEAIKYIEKLASVTELLSAIHQAGDPSK